jgi:hypothetical protein
MERVFHAIFPPADHIEPRVYRGIRRLAGKRRRIKGAGIISSVRKVLKLHQTTALSLLGVPKYPQTDSFRWLNGKSIPFCKLSEKGEFLLGGS